METHIMRDGSIDGYHDKMIMNGMLKREKESKR